MNETNQTDRFAPLFAELDRRLAGEAPCVSPLRAGARAAKRRSAKFSPNGTAAPCSIWTTFFSALSSAPPRGLAEPGGNVDRERFLAEVLLPLRRGEKVFTAVRLRFHAAAKCRGDRAEKARRYRGGILHAPRPCAVLRSLRISGHLPGIAARAHFPPQHAGESETLFCRMDPDGAGVLRRVRYSGKVHAAPSHTVKKEEAPAISSSSTAPPGKPDRRCVGDPPPQIGHEPRIHYRGF